jgi:hypothetical protein
VETVIINDKIIMENRELTTLNAEEVMGAVKKAKDNLLGKLKANVK